MIDTPPTIDEVISNTPEYLNLKNQLVASLVIAKTVIPNCSETAVLAVFDQLRNIHSPSDYGSPEFLENLH